MKRQLLIPFLFLAWLGSTPGPSTAQDDPFAGPTVVAQGVVLVSGEFVWEIGEIETAPNETTGLAATVAGFAIGRDGAAVLTGTAATDRQLLTQNQAGMYQGAGASLTVTGDDAARLTTIMLAQPEEADPAGAFELEGGYRDIELQRVELPAGDFSWTGKADFPAGYVVTDGEISVSPEPEVGNLLVDGSTISVEEGATATLFIAVVGAVVPDISAAGSVTLRAYLCSDEVTESDLPNENCDLSLEGFAVTLDGEALGGAELTLADALPLEDGYEWNALPISDEAIYRVTIDQLPPGYGQVWLIAGESEPESSRSRFSLTSEASSMVVSAYFLPASATPAGSVTVYTYACPDAATPDEECIATGTGPLPGITFRHEDGVQTLAGNFAEETGDGGLRWTEVPEGSWWLYPADLAPPEGYVIRNVTGSVETTDEGWHVTTDDPEYPAMIHVLLAPEGSEPAAG